MIPVLRHSTGPVRILGIPIHWFGVLVAIGVIIGDRIVVQQGAGAASTATTSST